MADIEKSNLNIIIPGMGCCSSEMLAARGPVYDIQRFGINIVTIPEDADIMVISGFISEAIVERFLDTYNHMRKPGWVFAAGSCAISGGRLCGSPVLLKKLKNQIPIDMYIPGCPPRPEAFIFALLKFISNNIEVYTTKAKNV
jgi:NADH-quinone oxidoreductase subunit B